MSLLYEPVLIVTCDLCNLSISLGSLLESPSIKGCVLTQPARVLARNRQKGVAYQPLVRATGGPLTSVQLTYQRRSAECNLFKT
jgi:hypothetical protein